MKTIFILWAFSLSVFYTTAQTASVSDMQVPDAPGFVLADKAPSAIDKPATPRAFGISIYSLQQGGALQATPFWFFQHPAMNQKKFLDTRYPLLQTFNISVSTFKTDTTSNLAVGFRTHLLRIYSKANKKETLKLDTDAATEIAKYDLSTSEGEEQARQGLKPIVDKIAESVSKPEWRIELAAAYLGGSSNNSFKSLAASKAGAWFNAS